MQSYNVALLWSFRSYFLHSKTIVVQNSVLQLLSVYGGAKRDHGRLEQKFQLCLELLKSCCYSRNGLLVCFYRCLKNQRFNISPQRKKSMCIKFGNLTDQKTRAYRHIQRCHAVPNTSGHHQKVVERTVVLQ